MKKLLLTAFEPYGGETVNPSLEVARALGTRHFPGVHVEIVELPVARFQAVEIAINRMRSAAPEFVIMLGESPSRFRITPERVAINVEDFPIPDNGGTQPQGERIVEDGPVGYFSTLPIAAIVTQLKKAHIPAAISNSAGTYLCNRLFYSVMHWLAVEQLPIYAGFMHLPYLHEQTVTKLFDFPSLSSATMLEAVRIAIEVSLQECATDLLKARG